MSIKKATITVAFFNYSLAQLHITQHLTLLICA
jgi:hypothetical protein